MSWRVNFSTTTL